MASLNTSEFEFGFIFFAKFNELNNYRFSRVIIPNQFQEGNPKYKYNGADIVLNEYFLQIKMPSYINWKKGNPLSSLVPYFKFRVYNTVNHKSNKGQLDFMKIHASRRNRKVYYVSPCFNSNYTNQTGKSNFWCANFYRSNPDEIFDFVTFIDISSINNSWIDNTNSHFICYKEIGDAYFLSEPKTIKRINPLFNYEEDLLNIDTSHDRRLAYIIRQRINEIGEVFGDDFFEINNLNIDRLDLFALQEIFLTRFNIFWLPILIPNEIMIGMKVNKIRENI